MKKPHNNVKIKLPFRVSFGPFSVTRKREIGFLFDKYVSHAVYIESGANNGKEFEEWSKIENGAVANFEFLYQAAVHYCKELRRKDNFTRVSLKRALLEATKEQIEPLTECMKRSEMYGATYKKKVVKKKPNH